MSSDIQQETKTDREEEGRISDPNDTIICLYDELFSLGNAEHMRECIDKTYDSIEKFKKRMYDAVLNEKDRRRSEAIASSGNSGLKLVMILLAITHESSIRDTIECDAAERLDSIRKEFQGSEDESEIELFIEETMHKIDLFYRVLSIGVRSLYETPYTELNAQTYVRAFLNFCFFAWSCCDSDSMEMLCDAFSSRRKPLSCDIESMLRGGRNARNIAVKQQPALLSEQVPEATSDTPEVGVKRSPEPVVRMNGRERKRHKRCATTRPKDGDTTLVISEQPKPSECCPDTSGDPVVLIPDVGIGIVPHSTSVVRIRPRARKNVSIFEDQ